MPVNCLGGMCNPQRVQGLKTQVPKGKHTLIDLKGPGLFLAGHVTKQGGATGLTFVELTIDGRKCSCPRIFGASEHRAYRTESFRSRPLG
jgi:hypothetical protein